MILRRMQPQPYLLLSLIKAWQPSDLSKQEFGELLELTMAFAAAHGVNIDELERVA